MKELIAGFTIIALIFPTKLLAQKAEGFEIEGHIDGVKDGEVVRLGNRFADWHELELIDSCVINRGEFHLTGKFVAEGPRIYELWFSGHRVQDKILRKNIGGVFCILFINNGERIKIRAGDINKMQQSEFSGEINIEGSPSNLAKASIMPIFRYFQNCYDGLNRKLDRVKDSVGFDHNLIEGLIDSKFILDDGLNAILSNSQQYYKPAIPLILCDINEVISASHYHASFVAELYKRLDEVTKASYYGKQMKEYAKLSVGEPFPNFALPTPDGKIISLERFVAKNKITIVHFWGSNSYERDKYQQELRILYRKYRDKGLDIIAVAADSIATEWKARVLVEQYPWVNVSDLKGNLKGSIVNDVYNEGGHSIPNTTNVLVDSSGKIIAWDVAGLELQWYLWKYLGDQPQRNKL